MGVAAVPAYVKGIDKTVPPGHRFGLYFPYWKEGTWEAADKEKPKALETVLEIDRNTRDQLKALLTRQRHLASALGGVVLSVPSKSTAPFMTGIGMEHPLENGFAFLNPYGLPYLPGSGIKGVLRKAAEDLALGRYGETCGWSIADVWWLFGFEGGTSYLVVGKEEKIQILKEKAEALRSAYLDWAGKTKAAELGPLLEPLINQACSDKEEVQRYRSDSALFLKELTEKEKKHLREAIHNRGALVFWDVFPEVAGDKLAIDILTPHYHDYYEAKTPTPPSDCGQPIPNPFLTLPPGSSFEFHVQYNPVDAPGGYYDARWKELIQAAFKHAFDWMGFGAKTSVGYGQMKNKEKKKEMDQHPNAVTNDEKFGRAPAQAQLKEVWEKATLVYRPNDGRIVATLGQKKADTLDRSLVPEEIQKRLFEKRKAVTAKVEVEKYGNAFRVVRIEDEQRVK